MNNTYKPVVYLIAGPNGAGKTTSAFKLLPENIGIQEFVNADTIAAGLSAFNSSSVAFQAGRILLNRIKELAAKNKNFAFESTLSSKSFYPFLKNLKNKGYVINLIYIWLRNETIAVERVKQRYASGGHFIPDDIVKRRYFRSINNLVSLYIPISDNWKIYDNSYISIELIAEKGNDDRIKIYSANRFNKVMNQNVKEPEVKYSADKITQAMKEAIDEELEKRKKLGLPIVVWKDGKVVHLTGEQYDALKKIEREKENR